MRLFSKCEIFCNTTWFPSVILVAIFAYFNDFMIYKCTCTECKCTPILYIEEYLTSQESYVFRIVSIFEIGKDPGRTEWIENEV